jgi:hypothetical protein
MHEPTIIAWGFPLPAPRFPLPAPERYDGRKLTAVSAQLSAVSGENVEVEF